MANSEVDDTNSTSSDTERERLMMEDGAMEPEFGRAPFVSNKDWPIYERIKARNVT